MASVTGDDRAIGGWMPDDQVVDAVVNGGRTADDLSPADVHWVVVVMSQEGATVVQIADALGLGVRWVKRIRADIVSAVMVSLRDALDDVDDQAAENHALRAALIRNTP